ncbi:MAG: APC family permease [Terriglobales bacterium]
MGLPRPADSDAPLIRGVGVASATAFNMIDMIGVGPFITVPLIVSAAGGPQAMLGWIFGAFFALCDGMVWAELGAAMPGSGGSYRYLNEIYGRKSLGRMISFLYIWQLSFSAPLSIASGCIGLSQYAAYLWPPLEHGTHQLGTRVFIAPVTFVAVGACVLAVVLLYRRITAVSVLSRFLWVGVIGTVLWVIFAGLTHFNAARAFSFPPGAFTLSREFFLGMGSAMLFAAYDYWGYYNVCFFAGEVQDPARTIPRALMLSIILVSTLYLLMNISILGVVPWQTLVETAHSGTRQYFLSTFMQTLYGPWAGYVVTLLIMWTAFASVFSLLLGYSRVPYAAAVDGNYFRVFARVDPRRRFPHVSLLALGTVAAVFCFFRLSDVIAALVVIRIILQFLLQSVGVIILRIRRPDMPRPFRMWLCPLPPIIASCGFLFILLSRRNFVRELRYALVLLVVGLLIFLWRSWRRDEWPFGAREASEVPQTSDVA